MLFIKYFNIFFNLILILKFIFAESGYNYKSQNLWKENYKQCGMNHQSPIELVGPANKLRKLYTKIKFYNYRKSLILPINIKNNGHTIQVTPAKTCKLQPFITGNFLPGRRYELESFHFHWGSKNSRGTEHTLHGHNYALEMHIVHKNSKYKTIEEAMYHSDGLVVIGVLYKASKSLSDYNFGLGYITWHLIKLNQFGSTYNIDNHPFSMMNILGDLDRNKFFAYEGSLTTPPCTESVTWIVYQDVQKISEFQLKKFRMLKDADDNELSDNFRRLKPLRDRHVYYYSE